MPNPSTTASTDSPHGDRAHSWVSPSGLERALACAAAPSRIAAAPPEIRSTTGPAAFGESAHEYAETHLRAWSEPDPGDERTPFIVDYLATIRGQVAAMGATAVQLLPEHHVIFAPGAKGVPTCGGTMDCGIVDVFDRRLFVYDLKTGHNLVSAHGNVQLGAYAIGLLRSIAGAKQALWAGWEVTLVIVQSPAADAGLPVVSEWQAPVEWLVTLDKAARKAIKASKAADPVATAGPHCDWCKGAIGCPARDAELSSVFPITTADGSGEEEAPSPPSPEALPPLALSRVLDLAPRIRDYLDACFLHATRFGAPGWKLVQGRKGHRNWTTEEAAVQMMRDHGILATVPVVKSPAVVEKEMGKKAFAGVFQDVVVQSAGKPTLVPEADGRTAIDPSAAFPTEAERDPGSLASEIVTPKDTP